MFKIGFCNLWDANMLLMKINLSCIFCKDLIFLHVAQSCLKMFDLKVFDIVHFFLSLKEHFKLQMMSMPRGKDMVSRFFTPIDLTPYHFTPILIFL